MKVWGVRIQRKDKPQDTTWANQWFEKAALPYPRYCFFLTRREAQQYVDVEAEQHEDETMRVVRVEIPDP